MKERQDALRKVVKIPECSGMRKQPGRGLNGRAQSGLRGMQLGLHSLAISLSSYANPRGHIHDVNITGCQGKTASPGSVVL